MSKTIDSHVFIAIAHIVLFVPFLLYVGIQRASIPNWVYTLLLSMGSLIFVYHGWKAFVRVSAASPYAWVNIIHAAAIAPLLVFIGYKGRDTPRYAYEILLMVGFAGLGYHLYSLVRGLQVHYASKDVGAQQKKMSGGSAPSASGSSIGFINTYFKPEY